jgi:transcriptional regulator with XRE-family HTH domain
MANVDIGKRLRSVREACKLSQRQLASRAGVTNGTISMIEQNKISPSVANLKKILDGIPMGLARFFMEESENTPKTFYRHEELAAIRTSVVHGREAPLTDLTLLRVGRPGTHSLMMLYEVYEIGADTGHTLYSHESEEAGMVITGQIEITAGEEVAVLNPGDAYIFDSLRPHRFRNVGTERCVLISACTPPTF